MAELLLPPRLEAIARQVPAGARLTDVGTDHAYLPAALLRAGKIAGAIATDVNEGPLRRGGETARAYGLEAVLELRLTDGLQGIGPEETDAVVIAGMGGELIAQILARAPWTRGVLLLLQPMTAQAALRRWLLDQGYVIQRETLVREGEKFYQILTVRGGEETRPYTPGELWAGRQARGMESPHRLAFLEQLITRRQRALEGMGRGMVPEAVKAQEKALTASLEALREEWNTWQQ